MLNDAGYGVRDSGVDFLGKMKYIYSYTFCNLSLLYALIDSKQVLFNKINQPEKRNFYSET